MVESSSMKPEVSRIINNKQTRIISDYLGNLITEEKQIIKHFKQYFNQLLNQPVVKDNKTIYYHTTELKIEKPQQEINNLKNNIGAKLLKNDCTEIRRKIKEMISIIN